VPSDCATFYVQSFGHDNKLVVNDVTFDLRSDLIGFWQQIYVDGLKKAAKVDIQVYVGKYVDSWVAIDDFYFNPNCRSSDFGGDVTTTTTTEGPKVAEQVDFECSSGKSIAAYLRCDEFLDCDEGEDESKAVCGKLKEPKCGKKGIYCKKDDKRFCLEDVDKFCDGTKDCEDGSDEDPRLCDSEISCFGFCQQDGKCRPFRGKLDTCECKSPFTGKRCQYGEVTKPTRTTRKPEKVVTTQEPVKTTKTIYQPPTKATTTKKPIEQNKPNHAEQPGSHGLAIAGSVFMGLIVAAVIAAFLYKKQPWRNLRDDEESLVNPVYDVQLDELRSTRTNGDGGGEGQAGGSGHNNLESSNCLDESQDSLKPEVRVEPARSQLTAPDHPDLVDLNASSIFDVK
jgi:hypothetical protein